MLINTKLKSPGFLLFSFALQDHIVDYQRYFNKVSIDLGLTDSVKNPTDVRIEQFSNGNDSQLVALCFQFGRYLLISSSRPDGQPANLQGVWNNRTLEDVKLNNTSVYGFETKPGEKYNFSEGI